MPADDLELTQSIAARPCCETDDGCQLSHDIFIVPQHSRLRMAGGVCAWGADGKGPRGLRLWWHNLHQIDEDVAQQPANPGRVEQAAGWVSVPP